MVDSDDLPPMLTTRDMSRLLKVGRATIYALVAAGKLPPPIRLNSRLYRWPRERVVEFLQQGTPNYAAANQD